jgi:hypothetical protein
MVIPPPAPQPFISVATHLCIDQRKASDEHTGTYVGPWLPESIIEAASQSASDRLEVAESVSKTLVAPRHGSSNNARDLKLTPSRSSV